jgi:hypothetical protein
VVRFVDAMVVEGSRGWSGRGMCSRRMRRLIDWKIRETQALYMSLMR